MTLPLKHYSELLASYIKPQLARFVFLSVLLFSSIALQVFNPQVIRSFIDAALAGEVMNVLLINAAIFIGVALLQQVMAVGVTYLGENVAWTATNALRAELARHCLNLDMGFHNNHTPGELIERIDGDVAEMSTFFSQFVVVMIGNVLLLTGILVALFIENWQVGLVFSIFAVITILVLNRVRDIALPYEKQRRQAEADLYGFVEEQLSGTEDIRSSGAVDYSLRELTRLQKDVYIGDKMTQWKNWQLNVVMGALLTIGNLMALGLGYWLYRNGTITIGTVYLLINYINLIEMPIWTLTHEVRTFQTIGACVERLIELRKISTTVKDGNGDLPAGGALGLHFNGVTFAYNGDAPVLDNLTFKLEPGQVLGLLGRTGSGKTTVTRLVFRLYDPVRGEIRLDGANLSDIRQTALRQRVAMVTQEVQLFRASVRDNLTFFDRSISDERILAVIEDLGLSDWLAALPNGLDTLLATGGHSLSAGEAQLLAFTRVFLRDPGLVILDEASSRLDPATEQRIERAVDRLLKGRTAIIVAHRLGTVHRADSILILEDGRSAEYGARVALASDSGSRFYQLLQTGLEEVLV
ncbi:MAG: ABC transporter ATP-binding protein [Anaerolineae bacterium]|nr:ABC transporter ATP-binding protein [Anaerolineae bacterium]